MILKHMVYFIILLGSLFFYVNDSVYAAESWTNKFKFTGWIETIQSMRIKSPNDAITSRIGGRLKLSAYLDNFFGFVSVDAEKNWEIDNQTDIDLHEAWIEHVSDGWDCRIGRQIIIWGKADGVQITDIISPPDYTESMTRELDEIRMPVDAAKFRLLGDYIDTEFIWIPVFKSAIQPTGDNPWAVQQSLPSDFHISTTEYKEPDSCLENSEIALKVSAFLSGFDAAASIFYTWDDYPVMHRKVHSEDDITHILYTPKYHRMTVFGLECSLPWSDFVFRSEAAYYKDRYYSTKSLSQNPIQKDAVKWLGGIDWSPGNDWTLIAQLTEDWIMAHEESLADKEHTLMATFNISKKLMHQLLTLSSMFYYSITNNEFYDRMTVEYALTDAFHVYAGADIFSSGDNKFGVYRDNSQVWLKAKYNF